MPGSSFDPRLFCVLALALAGCGEPPSGTNGVEIVSWSVDRTDGPLGKSSHLSGTMALRLSTTQPEARFILERLNLAVGPGSTLVPAVRAADGAPWPADVKRGDEALRTIAFDTDLPFAGAPTACVGFANPELDAWVSVTSDVDGSTAQAHAGPVPLSWVTPPDWGFSDVTLATIALSGAGVGVGDVAVAKSGATWLLVYDPGPRVIEVGTTDGHELWNAAAAEVRIFATDVGPVLFSKDQRLVRQLSASSPWQRTAGCLTWGAVHASGDRVWIGCPADDGVDLDGALLVPSTPDTTALVELDAQTGSPQHVELVPGAGTIRSIVALADGGVAFVRYPFDASPEIIDLAPTFEERFHVDTTESVDVLTDGAAGDLFFLASSGTRVGRLDSAGHVLWTVTSPHRQTTSIAPLASGGALIASGDTFLGELGPDGAVLRSEEVACDSMLWVAGDAGTAHLAGLVGATIAVDGEARDVPTLDYRAVRAVRAP